MDVNTMKSMLDIGETVAVEFKRCGNGIESDTYESVCSFMNRFGGDIFLGVLNDGTVLGVPEEAAPDMIKNFITVISNPVLFAPTIYLTPEIIAYEGKTVIHIHVPPSAEVHSYKKVIYDRVDDADVKVTATSQIAAMYIRKQNIFTEKKIYPYVSLEDLRVDLLPRFRKMAANNVMESHPWEDMDDEQLMKSAGLYGVDRVTGEQGYNLAAVMLLGKDDVILDVAPSYVTDAIVRKVNVDRYDDREVIKTNLVESYERLMEFARKHLPDKFFLEEDQRKSLRSIIAREMLVNTVIHRELTSSYIAKFVIEKEKMFVENANRAVTDGIITPDNLEPNPKNPIIAAFFRNIGYSDQLGSGVRYLYKYTKFYSGEEPIFQEGDVFRITVPLNESYSFDFEGKSQINGNELMDSSQQSDVDKQQKSADKQQKSADKKQKSVDKQQKSADKQQKSADKKQKSADKQQKSADKQQKSADKKQKSADKKSVEQKRKIIQYAAKNGKITSKEVESLLAVGQRRARAILSKMEEEGILVKQGAYRSTAYILSETNL